MEKVEEVKKDDEKPKIKFRKDHIMMLVISSNRHNYYELFKGLKIEGIEVRIEQCSWNEISMSTYMPTTDNPYGCVVEIQPKLHEPFKGTFQGRKRTIQPDFLLVRNICKGIFPLYYQNVLYGFMYGNIPSVNNLNAQFMHLERPLIHAELKKIQMRLGKDQFPLIEQYYHAYGKDVNFPPEPYPVVGKIGNVHAGFGKMFCENFERLRDFNSIVSVNNNYCTTERFIKSTHELRLQKIGSNYRAYKKKLISQYWKSNALGTASIEDVELTKQHILWLDECSKILGGLDIFALDVLVTEDGKFYILELNGCSIGFGPNHIPEDLQCIKELCIEKIKKEVLNIKEEKDEKKSEKQVIEDLKVENVNLKNKMMEKDTIIEQKNFRIKKLMEDIEKLKNSKKNNSNKFLGIFGK